MSSNEINAELLNKAIDGIEKHEADMLEDRMSTMAKLKQRYVKPRQAIKDLFQTATEGGIPKAELKRVLKERELMRTLAKVSADAEPDSLALIEQMRAALKPVADLPLFGAAIERAEREAEADDSPKKRSHKKKSASDSEASGEIVPLKPRGRTKDDDAALSELLNKADEQLPQ